MVGVDRKSKAWYAKSRDPYERGRYVAHNCDVWYLPRIKDTARNPRYQSRVLTGPSSVQDQRGQLQLWWNCRVA